MKLSTILVLILAPLVSSASGLTKEEACGINTSNLFPVSYASCLQSHVVPEKIAACRRNLKAGMTFESCLTEAETQDLTAERIDVCGESSSTATGFHACLVMAQNPNLDTDSIGRCESPAESFYVQCLLMSTAEESSHFRVGVMPSPPAGATLAMTFGD